MIVLPNEILKRELRRLKRKDLLLGFAVSGEDYQKYLAEVEALHPKYTDEQKEAWAAYTALTHPRATPPPDIPPKKVLHFRIVLTWAIIATLGDIILILCLVTR